MCEESSTALQGIVCATSGCEWSKICHSEWKDTFLTQNPAARTWTKKEAMLPACDVISMDVDAAGIEDAHVFGLYDSVIIGFNSCVAIEYIPPCV